jgi:hypothetical protein
MGKDSKKQKKAKKSKKKKGQNDGPKKILIVKQPVEPVRQSVQPEEYSEGGIDLSTEFGQHMIELDWDSYSDGFIKPLQKIVRGSYVFASNELPTIFGVYQSREIGGKESVTIDGLKMILGIADFLGKINMTDIDLDQTLRKTVDKLQAKLEAAESELEKYESIGDTLEDLQTQLKKYAGWIDPKEDEKYLALVESEKELEELKAKFAGLKNGQYEHENKLKQLEKDNKYLREKNAELEETLENTDDSEQDASRLKKKFDRDARKLRKELKEEYKKELAKAEKEFEVELDEYIDKLELTETEKENLLLEKAALIGLCNTLKGTCETLEAGYRLLTEDLKKGSKLNKESDYHG